MVYKFLTALMIAALAMCAPASAAYDPNRIVTAIDAAAGTFSCEAKPGEPVYTYRISRRTVFRTSGKRPRLSYVWSKGSLSDIKIGDRVTVQYHLDGERRIADRVILLPRR